jgi:hypothetical protein
MGKKSRDKGASYEREIANLFKTVYPDAKRGIGQARSASEVPDVDGTPFWVECKDHKATLNLAKVYVKATIDRAKSPTIVSQTKPIVIVWKRHRGRTDYATMVMSTLFDVVKAGTVQRFESFVTLELKSFLDLCCQP